MAMNPMQRKANNSFLLGILITLLITGIIIAFLIFQVMKLNKEKQDTEATLTDVYVLTEDVKSGQIITNDLFVKQKVFSTTVPSNAIKEDISILSSYFLADEQGNQAYTGYKIKDDSNLLGNEFIKDSDGYIILSKAQYDSVSEQANEQQMASFGAEQAQYIPRQIDRGNNNMVNVNCEIKKDENTEDYYILVPTISGTTTSYTKEILETMPLLAKINMNANTVITADMISEGQLSTDDLRTQEYNVITPMTQLVTGDYIDVRLRTSDGRDLLVLSKKAITIPELEDGTVSATNMLMNLTEEETLVMSCAIVETYKREGTKLYATKYVEPGIQSAATLTYVPNDETKALIERDPNIVQEAKTKLLNVLNGNTSLVRPGINSAINNEDAASSVTSKTEEEITSLQEERESYVESLIE